MKKTLFLILFILILLPVTAQAESFSFTSYYPTPSGNYQSIHLTPQPALPSNNCNIGTIYANADDKSLPYFCAPMGAPSGTFSPIAGPWTLSGNDLFLTDTTSPLNKKVGIGTATPIFKLTIENDGGILADGLASASSALPVSGAGTRMMWYPAKGAFRAGYVSTTQWDDANIGTSSIAMGYDNIAASQGASVWGGQNNSASGGASPFAPVITGGQNNTTTKELAQILGGSGNSASAFMTQVAGKNNTNNSSYSIIRGGENNKVNIGTYSVIAGGYGNVITCAGTGSGCLISGGGQNTATIPALSVAGSLTISGGRSNNITQGDSGTISGGQNNTSSAYFTVISAGNSNTSSGYASTVSAGYSNTASKSCSTIAGGSLNSTRGTASGDYASVTGGNLNTASGDYANVVGGYKNQASGDRAVIPGGKNNTAAGAYSLAAGQFMNIAGAHSFVWGYAASAVASIATSNAMIIYSGSMGIRDTNPAALLEINGNGSADDYLNLTSTSAATVGNVLTIKNTGFVGVNQSSPIYPLQFGNGAYVDASGNFMPASSRAYKTNIAGLDYSQALDAFTKLNPVQYNYKNETDHRYLGFIAEDVPDLVADQNRQGLAPMDIAAVLTKVIAHQHAILKEQQANTDRLLKEVAELKNSIHARDKTQ